MIDKKPFISAYFLYFVNQNIYFGRNKQTNSFAFRFCSSFAYDLCMHIFDSSQKSFDVHVMPALKSFTQDFNFPIRFLKSFF